MNVYKVYILACVPLVILFSLLQDATAVAIMFFTVVYLIHNDIQEQKEKFSNIREKKNLNLR